MILKYFKDGVWGYIDNIRQAASKDIDVEEAVKEYDAMNFDRPDDDGALRMNGVKLDDRVITSNKVFMAVCVDMADEGVNRHAENIIDFHRLDMPITAVLVYLEDCKEYDAILLVTNQKAFLMNDKGQTIERLN